MSLLTHGSRRATAMVLVALLTLFVGPTLAAANADEDSAGGNQTRPYEPAEDEGPDVPAPKSGAPSHVPASHVPRVDGLPVTTTGGGVDGLTLQDQRDSNQGDSFSLEPPDQALCVGGGEVIEGVNNVFATYNTTGNATSDPQSYDPFWTGKAEIIRHDDGTATYGPFLSDPKCYYDPGLDRFFMTELQLGTDPDTGAFTGSSFEDIAVSKTSTPSTDRRDWHRYKLNVRNDGKRGTPKHTGCPCLGDQPLIGADANGFYITTNEFPIAEAGFNGAQIYAFDKKALANGTYDPETDLQRLEEDGRQLAEGTAYSVQPATSPTVGQWSSEAGGTEYFLSALEFTGKLDNRIATWALTNTESLRGDSPDVHLSHVVQKSEVYGVPPKADQKDGPTPLADALKFNKEELIDTNDDRMNQVVYSDGRLWSALNTVVKTPHGPTNAGIAYFVASPGATGGSLTSQVTSQGYVAVDRNDVMFPSIGVTDRGQGVMVFSLSGPEYYPSAAVVHLAKDGSLGSGVEVVKAGTKPDDGFTGYPEYGGNGVGRWGDYSAAVADGSGTVWTATEYIPGTFGYPDYLANWGTAIASVTP